MVNAEARPAVRVEFTGRSQRSGREGWDTTVRSARTAYPWAGGVYTNAPDAFLPGRATAYRAVRRSRSVDRIERADRLLIVGADRVIPPEYAGNMRASASSE